MIDEMLPALRLLWRGEPCSMHGKYYTFDDVESFPTPVQNPMPIYIGGNSPQGRRRVVDYGDGWLPAALSVDEIKAYLQEIYDYAEEKQRDLTNLEVAPQFHVYVAKTQEEAEAKFRETQMYKHNISLQSSTLKNHRTDPAKTGLVGSVEHVRELVGRFVEAGVTTFSAMIFSTNTLPEMLDMMQLFSEDVMKDYIK